MVPRHGWSVRMAAAASVLVLAGCAGGDGAGLGPGDRQCGLLTDQDTRALGLDEARRLPTRQAAGVICRWRSPRGELFVGVGLGGADEARDRLGLGPGERVTIRGRTGRRVQGLGVCALLFGLSDSTTLSVIAGGREPGTGTGAQTCSRATEVAERVLE